MIAYEFYLRDQVKGNELLGILPERRKTPSRITKKSVMGWAKKVFGNDLSAKGVYFIEVEINNDATPFRPSPSSELKRKLQSKSA